MAMNDNEYDETAEIVADAVAQERAAVVAFLRARADAELKAGRETDYYVLCSAAWAVEARGTARTFEAKVRQATGMTIADIPLGDPVDVLAGQIAAYDASTNTYLVYGGYPHVGEDGAETWPASSARIVTLPIHEEEGA